MPVQLATFLFEILGFSFYAIVGIASLPSVGSAMTKAQWDLVMGPLVWAALAFGTTHVMIMGVEGWNDQEKWPGNMPPITLLSSVVPLFVMFLKFVLMVLSLYRMLVKSVRKHAIHPISSAQESV